MAVISQAAVWLFDAHACRPYRRSHSSIGGPTIPLRQPKSNLTKHWFWQGTPPHDTRMHRYASLTTGQKDAWKALAAELNNDHSTVTPAPYCGPIAYMVVNLYRRLQGDSYTDDAPTDDPPASSLSGILEVLTTDPRAFAAVLSR